VLLPLLAAVPTAWFCIIMLTFSVDSGEVDTPTELLFGIGFVLIPVSVVLAFVFKWTNKVTPALLCARLPLWWPILVLIARGIGMYNQEDVSAVSAGQNSAHPGKTSPGATPHQKPSELRQQVIP
jgi:hypothetical protein